MQFACSSELAVLNTRSRMTTGARTGSSGRGTCSHQRYLRLAELGQSSCTWVWVLREGGRGGNGYLDKEGFQLVLL
jgi:hypothetical protein